MVYRADDDVYEIYGGSAVDISELTSSDIVYIAATDPFIAAYIDPGSLPNISGSCSINSFYYWDGDSWESVTNLNDGTSGIKHAGWVTFDKTSTTPQPRQFQGSTYYAYWYYFKVSNTLPDNMNIGIQTMPYFNIDELGISQCNAVWKGRAVYSFDKYGEYIYLSSAGAPQVLNGTDYGIIEVGDGRSNKVVAMRKFHNELMVWQEEKGVEGGCLTLIEGYSPQTFGKLILSSKIGAMNNNAVVVVDGVLTSTATDERIKMLAFFLSRYGVCVSDGRTVNVISDDIQNYFNPNEPECIRRGYENKMWLSHDSSENVLRLGLVCGSNATDCNVFPVFDLTDKVWYFDDLGQKLSCMIEVSAESGNVPVKQIAGTTTTGYIYLLNDGYSDDNEYIDSYIRLELGSYGEYITLRELLLRWKAQETGTLYLEVFVNGVSKARWNISEQPDNYGEISGRIRKSLGITGNHISIKIGNSNNNSGMYLEDLGLGLLTWKKR